MAKSGPFGMGEPNDAYARYFVGNSYLNRLTNEGVGIANVTFEPGCRNYSDSRLCCQRRHSPAGARSQPGWTRA